MRTIVIFLFFIASFAACSTEQARDAHADHKHEATETYSCPMHPNVVQDKLGKCPVCGMDLVKVTKSDAASNDVMLTDAQIKLANITTQKVSKKPMGQTIALTGRLMRNELLTVAITSRADGRLENLSVKETGQAIEKGQPLYTLYSEMLLTLQQEYLLAKEQFETLGNTEKRYKSFLDASEKKLLRYGLTKDQINQLKDRTSLTPRVTFLAPASGIVTEINASEGQYVTEGTTLYKIEDIGKLWVEAELYPNETSLVKNGDNVTVRVSGNENNPIEATVTFLSPEYRTGSQITILRASIDNPKNNFKPGQQVQVYLTHSAKEAIAVPVDAVIRDGKGMHVYVQAGINTFRPRMVKTGLESFNEVEIIEGLNEGDTIAISGAYLLYSEIVLKKGADPMRE
jgi:membrane fusion protein, copper/silver efflux system